MNALAALLIFIFGLIIGSFLNVVILRLNTGRNLRGRSHCFQCGHFLRWFELLPLLSFLGLRGRCASCQSKISFQYFFVELLTAVVFTFTFARLVGEGLLTLALPAQIFFTALYLMATSVLVVIAVYDLRHKIIPNGMVYSLIVLGLVRVLSQRWFFSVGHLWFVDIVSGGAIALGFALLWLLSRGRAMGFGDAKLALGLSWLLPFSLNISTVLFAFWSGALVGLALMLVSRMQRGAKRVSFKTEIPFAPFLIVAFFGVFIFNIHLSAILNALQIF